MIPELVDLIYDILVEMAGAADTEVVRQQFTQGFESLMANQSGGEYRVGGKFGFGFKFWVEKYDGLKFRVSQYKEDVTEESEKTIDEINASLDYLVQQMNETEKVLRERQAALNSITSPSGIFARMGVKNIVFEGSGKDGENIVVPVKKSLDDLE